jgi:1-acyl-sn-glycerol-3-phosphate acyltransferase
MNQMPLSDQLPYRFVRPRHDPICLAISLLLNRWKMRQDARIEAVDLGDMETLRGLLHRGDGVLLAPNHTDYGDAHLMVELSNRIGRPFNYMVAYQVLQGLRGWFIPRLGGFPVDREGVDLTAFKTAVDVLVRGRHPLVVFPEGEIHHLGDQVTPLHEGAMAIATTAAKRLSAAGKTVWIVPVAIKYRFLESHDPIPALHDLMDELERRAHWWVDRERPLVERIHRFASAMLGLVESEYLGTTRHESLAERLVHVREHILGRLETRRVPEARRRAVAGGLSVADRVKEVHRACLDLLSDPETSPEEACALRHDLHDVFVAFQTFSYTGEYLRNGPTLERAAETLMKFEGNRSVRQRHQFCLPGRPTPCHLPAVGSSSRS